MQCLIDDLLAYSRVGAQGNPIVPVSSETVLRSTLNLMAESIREHSVTIEAEPLPMVLADEGQLRQLFQNLIGNAIKFRREAVASGICISATRRNDHWLFSVRDNGIGIDMQFADRIFQMSSASMNEAGSKTAASVSRSSGASLTCAVEKSGWSRNPTLARRSFSPCH